MTSLLHSRYLVIQFCGYNMLIVHSVSKLSTQKALRYTGHLSGEGKSTFCMGGMDAKGLTGQDLTLRFCQKLQQKHPRHMVARFIRSKLCGGAQDL